LRRDALVRGVIFALVLAVLASLAAAREPWVVLNQCQLIPNESNDGDSFHVRAAGKEYLFRLYFVDAPETAESFPERL